MHARSVTQHRSIIHFLSVAALLGVTPRLLSAQLAAPHTASAPSVLGSVILASAGELTPGVQAHLTRGDSLTGLRRYTAAVLEYQDAARIARFEGNLPSLTLWSLASMYFYKGDLQRAGRVLGELQVDAVQFGDLGVEAVALFNAAWLSGKSGRTADARAKVAELERLLRSPYMPTDVRTLLTARLPGHTDVALKQ